MKILHVEDDVDVAEVVEFLLVHKGFQYESCRDGKTALKLIKENTYDFVLLDLSMPEFSGYDVIDSLVKEGNIDKQKIIVFTAHTLSGAQMHELTDKGVYSFLSKPIGLDALLEKLVESKDSQSIQI